MSGRPVSFARIALVALGSAALVLLVTATVIAVVQPSAGVGLIMAFAGVVVAIAVMGWASNRAVNRVISAHRDTPTAAGTDLASADPENPSDRTD